MRVAEIVLDFPQGRRRLQRDAIACALDGDLQLLAGIDADDPLHVGKIRDLASVDVDNDVARLETRRGRSAAGLDRVHARRGRLLAVDHEHGREDHDRQNEIGDRAGRDDHGAVRTL